MFELADYDGRRLRLDKRFMESSQQLHAPNTPTEPPPTMSSRRISLRHIEQADIGFLYRISTDSRTEVDPNI